MGTNSVEEYKYKGAKALVLLHEKYLTSFLLTWQEAKSKNISLPETDDSDYTSLETLLVHVFRAARGYMTWMCENLELPDPEIKPQPKPENVEKEADEYLVYLLNKWRLPLANLEEDKFHSPTFASRWGVQYCVDAMLEHAVMHPIRHEFQLRNLMHG